MSQSSKGKNPRIVMDHGTENSQQKTSAPLSDDFVNHGTNCVDSGAHMFNNERFLSAIAHEITYPLTMILGYTTMISGVTHGHDQRSQKILTAIHAYATMMDVIVKGWLHLGAGDSLEQNKLGYKPYNVLALLRSLYVIDQHVMEAQRLIFPPMAGDWTKNIIAWPLCVVQPETSLIIKESSEITVACGFKEAFMLLVWSLLSNARKHGRMIELHVYTPSYPIPTLPKDINNSHNSDSAWQSHITKSLKDGYSVVVLSNVLTQSSEHSDKASSVTSPIGSGYQMGSRLLPILAQRANVTYSIHQDPISTSDPSRYRRYHVTVKWRAQ